MGKSSKTSLSKLFVPIRVLRKKLIDQLLLEEQHNDFRSNQRIRNNSHLKKTLKSGTHLARRASKSEILISKSETILKS
ncbi:MAG: hypothetical protein UU05_C0035G0009 [Candidatus Curtissbacteria bacterium GW2011_GWA1_40_47]|nr:MAG: hypothetical protein UU05_C0035G0009 [Candidatus Curtissbacteria bacterium GW2011_GWA1_40_47]